MDRPVARLVQSRPCAGRSFLRNTECTEYQESFSAGVPVQATDLHHLNFVLTEDDSKNQYQVYSDRYVELIDKNLQTDFASLDFLPKG